MNIIRKMSLAQVVMPLVQVMERADISWRDRERVAAAINACNVQWEGMEQERQLLNQQVAQAQSNAMQGLAAQAYSQANAVNSTSANRPADD